jgi:signal transduction histidine kinase
MHAPEIETGSDLDELVLAHDWSKSPLGPIASWPPALRTTVSLCLSANFPMAVVWGPEQVLLYNDRYRFHICGAKHPKSMGQSYKECWAAAWPVLGPLFESALAGKSAFVENQRMFMDRNGYLEETFFTFSFSPIRDEHGAVGGLLNPCTDVTADMLNERRTRSLRDFAIRAANAATRAEAYELTVKTLGSYDLDVPFVLLYSADARGSSFQLAGSSGVDAELLEPARAAMPFEEVVRSGKPVVVNLHERFGPLAAGPYPEGPREAVALPITPPGYKTPAAVLVAGVSARRVLDEQYRAFYDLLGAAVTTALANALAREEEVERLEALAAIDRAKTAFFSNVSHEFRTPLTLMIGPTEDALASPEKALQGAELEMVHRNELRLLKLVNVLLDFSRIEAGRVKAIYRPTDLAMLTADLASTFRSAIEHGGLQLDVECPPLSQPVFVDRSMWEQIVLNLLSNAFKFTFEGTIRVTLREAGDRVELEVADTGIGIEAHELPRVFERFHRIEGTKSRTYEGSGIGLALVNDLVRISGGTIGVASAAGQGTTFRVSVPLGSEHLPAEQVVLTDAEPTGVSGRADLYVLEALRWSSGNPPASSGAAPSSAMKGQARVLVADDNADMREYLARLLGQHWSVETAADAAAAMKRAREWLPDLVLADVMMPGVDGFGLLRDLRTDARTRNIPVIMVSARAGEDARIDGLAAGADDYLIKPFSARELIARINSHLGIALAARQKAQLLERAQAARQDAEAANESKDEFLAMLGHELRNPLAPLQTSLQLIRRRLPSSPVDRQLDVIERQASNLARIVDDLLEVSRIRLGKIELRKARLDLGKAVSRALDSQRDAIEARRHDVSISLPMRPIDVIADAVRIDQVLVNLLTNAVKYTDVGGRIWVSVDVVGDRAELKVRDNGIGISSDLKPRLFGLFEQGSRDLSRTQGGLGIGLTVVRRLIELHGGEIEVHSDGPGRGSEFVVRLPLAPADTVPIAPEPAPPQEKASGRCRVLVVDDNQDAAEALLDLLMDLGHEAKVAFDGPSALGISAQWTPDLVFLDIGLPGMDGYAVARALKEAQPEPPSLVAITGYSQQSDREKARAAGFQHHLAKPASLEAIEDILARTAHR